MKKISLVFIAFCLSLFSFNSLAIDNNPFGVSQEPEFLTVDQAYQVSLNWQQNKVGANWSIHDGYYLYKHAFKFQLLNADGSKQTLALDIPKGKIKHDEYFGEVEVYHQQIGVKTQQALATSGKQILIVTSQGCADAGLCYPPQKQYFEIDAAQQTIIATEKPSTGSNGDLGTSENSSSGLNTTANDNALLSQAPEALPLYYYLIFAALGGLVLNLMPCVFPVLSLKVLSFAGQAEQSQKLKAHALVYTAGVVLSFVLVAAVMLLLRSSGEAIGWGFQLQSPLFIGALTYLFFIMGLSLMGTIEFGGRLMGLGQNLATKDGYSGSFFTGALAVVVASPCTAPFMSTALGYAVSQPALIALSIFAALGFGMALPFLLISFIPSLAQRLPKPGAWMDSFKRLLAFPMFATAIWLLWVASQQTQNQATTALLLGCLSISLAIFLKQEPAQKPIWRLGKNGLSLASLVAAIALLFQLGQKPAEPDWIAYSETKLEQLRSDQQAVFVNITADWCITCLVNEEVTLSQDVVKQAFKDNGVVYMKGDWTNYDENITALLAKYQRSGIPLYIYYPADGSPETLLPQILKADTVLNLIEKPAIAKNM